MISVFEVILLAALTAAHPPTDLVAAAAASGRPAECVPRTSKGGGVSVWTQSRVPHLRRYCFLVSRAHARIKSNPASAKKLALHADKLLPGRAAPHVVLARVALTTGDIKGALAAFELALKRDARSVEQPLAMMDLARANVASGKLDVALQTYRILVPRAALLPSRTMRAQILLEAAHVSMTAGTNVDEALAYLREAARDPHQALRIDVALSLVLTLDRAGHHAQANAVLAARTTRAWAKTGKADYLVDDNVASVLRGLALERYDRAAARLHYQRYLTKASGPYVEAVRRRVARLGGR